MVSIPIDIWTTVYTDPLRVQRILSHAILFESELRWTWVPPRHPMSDLIWIFISGYGGRYVRCPSFNWSLPLGLDRRILYGSHRTLSIMVIMAPDNGVFRFSTLRTGMRSFAYGMEFPSVIINHEKMAAMVFRYEPCGIISSGCLSDIASMTAIWRRLVDTYPSCWALYHVIIWHQNLSPDTSNGTVIRRLLLPFSECIFHNHVVCGNLHSFRHQGMHHAEVLSSSMVLIERQQSPEKAIIWVFWGMTVLRLL